MNSIFEQLGIEVTPVNKGELDQKIHKFVGVEYKNCSATWKAIKDRKASNEEKFLADLRKALA